jgi:hypothetical protein
VAGLPAMLMKAKPSAHTCTGSLLRCAASTRWQGIRGHSVKPVHRAHAVPGDAGPDPAAARQPAGRR